MTDRILCHFQFLQKLVKSKKTDFKRIILGASPEEIIGILNCVKKGSVRPSLTRKLNSLRNQKTIRRLLITNQACVKKIVGCVLLGILRLVNDLMCDHEEGSC